MTIDDAPSAAFEKTLNILEEQGIQAIFFCQGNKINGKECLLTKAIREGHIIGNHGFSHRYFSDLSLRECFEEIKLTSQLIHSLYVDSGVKDYHRLFRFPYGDKGDFRYGHHFWTIGRALNHHRPFWWRMIHKVSDLIGTSSEVKRSMLGEKRKLDIQSYLKELGYDNCGLTSISYNYMADLMRDVDWPWTIDVGEWQYYRRGFNDKVIHEILTRLAGETPYLGYGEVNENRGLRLGSSDEILLFHDHECTTHILNSLIRTIEELDCEFYLPELCNQ